MTSDQRPTLVERLYLAFLDDDLMEGPPFHDLDPDKRAGWERAAQRAEDLYLSGACPAPPVRDLEQTEELEIQHRFFTALPITWDMPTDRREEILRLCRMYAGAARAVMTLVPDPTFAGSRAQALTRLEESWLWAMRAACSVPR